MPRHPAAVAQVALPLALLAAGCSRAVPPTEQPPAELPLVTQSADCTASSQRCPEIPVAGDQAARLAGGQLSPARGYADPSIRRDPAAAALWMAYSWVYYEGAVRVESHLARSDDGGATWLLTRELWPSVPAVNGAGTAGWMNSEVVSLAARATAGGSTWYSARLRYFTPPGSSPDVRSFTIQVAAAPSPEALSSAPEAALGGDLTDAYWQPDVNLASLSGELAGCAWNDPALAYRDGALYLAVQCQLFVAGEEPVERQFVALFATTPEGSPRDWQWRYVGRLAGHAEAMELGGETLMQTDLAVGSDGRLLAIFSPSRPAAPLADHFGCRVVEVTSFEPPRLARGADGRLRVRASLTATDLAPGGPGACGYDAASATGVVLVRRTQGDGGLVVSLHQSGIRP